MKNKTKYELDIENRVGTQLYYLTKLVYYIRGHLLKLNGKFREPRDITMKTLEQLQVCTEKAIKEKHKGIFFRQ